LLLLLLQLCSIQIDYVDVCLATRKMRRAFNSFGLFTSRKKIRKKEKKNEPEAQSNKIHQEKNTIFRKSAQHRAWNAVESINQHVSGKRGGSFKRGAGGRVMD